MHKGNSTIMKRPKELIEHEVEDDLVLYDPVTDKVHILNPTAAAVWWLCEEETTVEKVASQMARLYSLDTSVAVKDVEEVLSQLTEAGLLVRE